MAQGDQVRIIFDGIAEIGLDTVDIRSEDVAVNIVSVPLGCLQHHFKVGDNVRVQADAQYGREGIVIVVGTADLTFTKHHTDESRSVARQRYIA
ncbi:hypothetical protein AcV5_001911 [Taiwanofungus camphoratus]|nr:hypothetical protein AcV5_001911 [Antrodia cinnamomea]